MNNKSSEYFLNYTCQDNRMVLVVNCFEILRKKNRFVVAMRDLVQDVKTIHGLR